MPADFDAILGLGSNVGDKRANIAAAIELLTRSGEVRLVRFSHLYRTEAWGKTDQDWFVNACIAVATKLDPKALLKRCQAVEQDLGRVRREHWGPRIIDVDILVYRDVTLNDPELALPHPWIAERAFVLAPLKEIAPELVVRGQQVRDLLAAIDSSSVTRLE